MAQIELFEAEYNIDEVMPDIGSPIAIRTDGANNELGQIVAPIVGGDRTNIAGELSFGSDAPLEQANGVILDDVMKSSQELLEHNIKSANSTEEVISAIENSQAQIDKPISLLSYRENYLAKTLNPDIESVPRISQQVLDNAKMAYEVEKARNKMWEQTGLRDVIEDFAELILPTGVASEEVIKFEQSVSSVLDKIEKASPEEKMEVLEAAVNTWVESETMIFGNNNSLITDDRLEQLRQALLDGGAGLIDGTKTQAEWEEDFFSLVNGTVFLGEVDGLAVGFKGIMQFLMNRIFPKPIGELKVPGYYLEYDLYRSSTRAADTEYAENPTNFYINKSKTDIKKSSTDMGLTEEEAVSRQLPTTVEEGNPAFPNTLNDIDEVNELILVDEDLSNIGMRIGKQLERDSGQSLKTIVSGTRLVPNEVPNSLGDFTIMLGDAGGLGFKTAEEASLAGSFGLKGIPFETVQQNGGYYNKVVMQHQFNARRDTKDLYADMLNPVGAVGEKFLDPLRILGDDVLKGVFVLKSVNRSKVQKQADKFRKAVNSFTAEKSEQLNKALKVGDKYEDEFGTKQAFADAIGVGVNKVSDDTFEAYKTIRGIMDDSFKARNENYRNLKESQGYRVVDIGDDGALVRSAQPGETVPDEVYQPSTGRSIPSEQVPLVMRADTPVLTPDGTLTRWVALDPSELKKLPSELLTKRKGHIDRFYRDTGWTVRTKGSQIVDGVEESFLRTTHIVRSRTQADAIKKKLVNEGAVVDDIQVVRARENDELDAIYGDERSVQYGYGSSHTKKRGGQLRGSEGYANVYDPLESVSRTIHGLQRDYDLPIMTSLESRFIKQYEPYLKQGGGTKFSSNLADMMGTTTREGASIPKEVVRSAKQWHNYIKGVRNLETSPVFSMIDDAIESVVNAATAGKLGAGVDTAKLNAELQNLTSNLVIVGRPMYQIPQNIFQAMYVGLRHTGSGARAVAQTPVVLSHLLGMSDNMQVLSRVLGTDPTTARALIKELKTNGLFDAVGRADDFLAMTHSDMTTSAASWWGFYAKKYGPQQAIKAPFKASQAAQEGSIKLVNMMSYLAEFREQVVKGGKPFNAKTKASISFNAQKLTQTQNGMNQFVYQNKGQWFSAMFQFMQHTHQLFLDVILDPLVTGAMGRNLGKATTPFSDKQGAALFTIAGVTALFGFDGIMGSNMGQAFSDMMRDNFPNVTKNPAADSLLSGGLINTFWWETIKAFGGEGKPDVTAKINPSSVIDTTYDHFLKNPGSIDMFGATGMVTGSLIDAARTVKLLAVNPDISTRDKAYNMAHEMASVVSGFKDAERARIAGLTRTWPYFSTLSGSLKVTEEEAIFGIFNVTPEMVNEFHYRSTFGDKGSVPEVERNSKAFIRFMNREMIEAKEDGVLDLVTAYEIMGKWVAISKASTDPLQWDVVERTFKRFAVNVGGETYEEYLKPHINADTLEERIQGLERMLQTASTEEAKQQIKEQLEFSKILLRQTDNIYREE